MAVITNHVAVRASGIHIEAKDLDPVTVPAPAEDASPEELLDFGALCGYISHVAFVRNGEEGGGTLIRRAAVAFLAKHRQDEIEEK